MMVLMGELSVLAVLAAVRSESWKPFAAAGAVNALSALTNTTFLPFGFVMVPAGMLWFRRARPTRGLRLALVYLAAYAAVYSPWPARLPAGCIKDLPPEIPGRACHIRGDLCMVTGPPNPCSVTPMSQKLLTPHLPNPSC